MNADNQTSGTGDDRHEHTSCTMPPQDTQHPRNPDEMTMATAMPPPRVPTPPPQPAYIPTPMPAPAATPMPQQASGSQPGSSGVGKPPEFLVPGSLLGRCRIEKLIGRGGMGAVYLARHTTLDIPVAVKVMFPEIAIAKPEFADRFMREAKLASRIRQTNVIQVMDAEHDDKTGLYYIVQEYIDGGTTRDLLREGVLSKLQALDIAIGVTRALVAAAEFKIVHRDIKPENIMMTKKGEVKLADLGIAKECGDADENLTVSQVMMGTPAYIAPEQARDAKEVDARADIYSLGATIYHLLCGAPPHTGDTTYSIISKLINDPTPDPRVRRPDLSAPFAELIMRMIDKHRDHRPKNAAVLLDELLAIRSTMNAAMPTPMPGPSPVPAGAEAVGGAAPTRQRKLRMVAIAGLGLLLLAMLFAWQLQRQAEAARNLEGFNTEMAAARAAYAKQDYDQARLKVKAAAARFSSESDEGAEVRSLQEKISADKLDRSQRFEAAIAKADIAKAKGDIAQARAEIGVALGIFPQGSKENQQAQALIDQLNDGVKAESSQRQTEYAAAIAAAKTALERQEYAAAQKSAGTAATLCAADSPEARTAKNLQTQAEAGLQARRQQFNAAMTALNAALAKNEFATAQQQAKTATGLCQPDSPEAILLRDANDRIAAAQKLEGERQQEQLANALIAAQTALNKNDLATARQQAETAKRLAPPGGQAIQANLLLEAIATAEKTATQTAAVQANAIAQAKAALAAQNYVDARKALATATYAPGTPEAETAKALLAQAEAGELLMQQRQRFEMALEATRKALAQKDLVTAKQQADLALAIFGPGTPEWQKAQALAGDIAKAGSGAGVPPAGVTPPPVAAVPLPPAGFGLVGLFNGKPGATATDLMNKTCYLRVNLWNDRAGITTLNVHNGPIIPAGTPVSSVQVSRGKLCFVVNGTSHAIIPSGYVRIRGGEDLAALQYRYFAEENPKASPAYQQFSQQEKDAIEKGQVLMGMSKEAVLMAYGYPSSHKTTTLESNAWFFWNVSKSSSPVKVDFENGRVCPTKDVPPPRRGR